MALPSQIERSAAAGRTFANKRRRRVPRAAVIGVALLMMGTGVWVVFLLRPNTQAEPAAVLATHPTEPKGAVVEPPKPKSLLESKIGVKPVVPEPTTIRQGVPAPGKPAEKTAAGPVPVQPDKSKPAPVDLTGGTGQNGSKGAAPTVPAGTSLPASSSADGVRLLIDEGDRLLAAGDPVSARAAYNRALSDGRTVRADQDMLRSKLAKVNEDLVFSNRVYKDDTLCEEYTVLAGDNPSRIARKRDLATEASLIERINKVDPRKIRVGQRLKLLRGPFHAVIHMAEFRLDLYAGSPDDRADWVFIRSFQVGLGASDSATPVGEFVVKSGSKLVNPHWTNPRTGERFDAEDAKNPIGERWIGVEGVGPSAVHKGLGLHGTIDPDSIGKQKSMGCVRLGADEVALLYEMLVEKVSVVTIGP